MSKCLKCTYPKTGQRICPKCQTPARDYAQYPENLGGQKVPAEWCAASSGAAVTTASSSTTASTPIASTSGALAQSAGQPARGAEPSTAIASDTSAPTSYSTPGSVLSSTTQSPPPGSELAAHSPLGGSGAERWGNCSASVELSTMLSFVGVADPEWTTEGVRAHEVAAFMLEKGLETYELVGHPGFEDVEPDMLMYLGRYVRSIRARPGRMVVEYKMHRPEIHQLFYGTLDCALYPVLDPEGWLEIHDLKYGAGIEVSARENPQLSYYAIGFIMEDPESWTDDQEVRLVIHQPRLFEEPDVWETTVGELKAWLYDWLIPRMELTQSFSGWYFSMGEWCRFCPAKVGCPAMANLARRALENAVGIKGSERDPKVPAGWRPSLTKRENDILKMLVRATDKYLYTALMNGGDPDQFQAKLVYGKANRCWSPGAEAALREKYGDQAFEPGKLLSPNQVEETLPEGSVMASRYATKPDGKPVLAPIDDPRTAVRGNADSLKLFSADLAKSLDLRKEE